MSPKSPAGFVYYVSLTGITGAKLNDMAGVWENVAKIKKHTKAVAVGIWCCDPEDAKRCASPTESSSAARLFVVWESMGRMVFDSFRKWGASCVPLRPRCSRPRACRRYPHSVLFLRTPVDSTQSVLFSSGPPGCRLSPIPESLRARIR